MMSVQSCCMYIRDRNLPGQVAGGDVRNSLWHKEEGVFRGGSPSAAATDVANQKVGATTVPAASDTLGPGICLIPAAIFFIHTCKRALPRSV